jgi:hypothetical protein
MLRRHTRKATSSIFYHLYYSYLTQRANSESRSAQIACELHSHPVLLQHSRTTTQYAGRSNLREVIYVTLMQYGFLKDLFELKGYGFESEHLSFDKYRRADLPEFHLSIRYRKGSEHIAVRVDYECIDNKVQRRGAISIKQYYNGEFASAAPVEFETGDYEALIDSHATAYSTFFDNLISGKSASHLTLLGGYEILERFVANALSRLSSFEGDSEEAQLIKAKLFDLLILIDKINNYTSNGELIGKTFILERMAYFEEIIVSKEAPQAAPAEEEISEEIVLSMSPVVVENPLSYEEKLVAELIKILPEIESSKNNAILGGDRLAIKHYENTVDTFSIVLIVLDIVGESSVARELVDEHKKDLLFNQDIVRRYHEMEKELLRTPEFKSTTQGWIAIAFVRAIAEEAVRECDSESPVQTIENKSIFFYKRARDQEHQKFLILNQ